MEGESQDTERFHPSIDEMAEAFGIACHKLVSLDFRCGSRLCKNSGAETFRATIEPGP